MNAEYQRIARTDKKAFFSNKCKEIRKTIEWDSRELKISREYFMQRWAQ